jgi:hypothetical protein
MAEVHLIKLPGGSLKPANQADADRLEKVKNGALVSAEIKQPRNPAFLRKYFAMLNFAFEYFNPEINSVKGMTPEKNFERFRKDVQIMAGYRSLVVNLKGEARWESDSISFGEMEEIEFSKLYSSVFNVCWKMVLAKVNGMTEEIAERTILQILSFD